MNRADEMDKDREQYWLWLCSIPGVYSRQMRVLTDYFGSPRAVYEASDKEFAAWKEKKASQEANERYNEMLMSFEEDESDQALLR